MCIFVPNATVLSEGNVLGVRFNYLGRLKCYLVHHVFTQGL